MAPYITLFIFGLAASIISLMWRKSDKYVALVFFIIIFLFIGLRYESVDYYGYWSIYDSVRSDGLAGFSKEKGFALLMKIEQMMLGHFFWFVLFFSLLSLSVKYKAISQLTPYLTLAFFVYVSSTLLWKDLGQIRNGFVAGMMLLAVVYAYKRQAVKFVIVVLLASQIHLVALVGFAIYFIRFIKSKKIMYFVVSTSFLVALGGGVGKLLLGIIPADAFGAVSSRSHSYVGSKYDVHRNILGVSSFINLSVIFFLIYNYDKLVKKSSYNSYLIPLAVMGISADYLISDFGILGGRIFDIFYTPSIIILITQAYSLVPLKQRWLTFWVLVVYCIVGFSYAVMTAQLPYQSILSI